MSTDSIKINLNFRVLASGSLPGYMTFRRNNIGLESLGFFPRMAQVQPMPNKELLTEKLKIESYPVVCQLILSASYCLDSPEHQ